MSLGSFALICIFSSPLSASVLKSTASSSGSASTGISDSVPSGASVRWSNSSHVTASNTAITSRPTAPSKSLSSTFTPEGGWPVHFAVSQRISVAPVSVRSNDSLSSELKDECVLWDSSCSGNKTAAALQFFKDQNGTSEYLLSSEDNSCFSDESSNCSRAVLSEYAKIKAWMRSPQCTSARDELGIPTQSLPVPPAGGLRIPQGVCCDGSVDFSAGNVDVFYWPEPEVNTSCLSVVGSSVLPLDYGATTDTEGNVYWGCTSLVWGANTADFGEMTYTDGDPYIGRTRAPHDFGPKTFTTAIITALNKVAFKSYKINPWGSQPCSESSAVPAGASSGIVSGASIYARGYPLSISPSLKKRNGTRVSTMISGGYTL